MMHDQLLVYNDYSPISERCNVCFEASHSVENCPFVHFKPNSDFLIHKFSLSYTQKRKEFLRKLKKKKNSLYYAAQNRYFALEMTSDNKEIRTIKSDDELDNVYQENNSSIMYQSDYSIESEDDFSEGDDWKNNSKVKSSNTLPSIKRDKMDSLEVIDEESKSRSGTLIVTNKSNYDLPKDLSNLLEDNKFTSKILDTKAFDTKRYISATEIKIESKVMTEGGKLFEDYLKRNSLLSKQSSINKGTPSMTEYTNKNNPHYKNVNAILSMTTDNKSAPGTTQTKRKNSIMIAAANNSTLNTATKSNKSSKVSKNTVFDMFMDIDVLARFEAYFPENNCENVLERIHKQRRSSNERTSRFRKDEGSFKLVNTLYIKEKTQKKSHFGFMNKRKKTSLDKLSHN